MTTNKKTIGIYVLKRIPDVVCHESGEYKPFGNDATGIAALIG